MAETKVFIHDLPGLTLPEDLLGKSLEVEGVDSAGKPLSFQLPAGVLLQAAAKFLPGPNLRRDLRKSVQYKAVSQPDYNPGASSLDQLDGNLLCLGATATVEADEDGASNTEYELQRDPTGPLNVWVDGSFTGNKTLARWVLKEEGGGGGLVEVTGITETLGSFRPGQSFRGTDNEAWNRLLKQDSPPVASLQADQPLRQPGAPVAVSLLYSVGAATYPLASVTVAGQSIPLSSQSGVVQTTTAPNTDTDFTLVAQDTHGLQTVRVATVRYRPLRFWFVSAVDPLSLSDAGLSALVRSQAGQEFSADRTQSRTFQANGQYLCFAWVATAGAASFRVNGLLNNAFQARDFQFTNSESFTQSFRLSRSAQQLTGTFTCDAF